MDNLFSEIHSGVKLRKVEAPTIQNHFKEVKVAPPPGAYMPPKIQVEEPDEEENVTLAQRHKKTKATSRNRDRHDSGRSQTSSIGLASRASQRSLRSGGGGSMRMAGGVMSMARRRTTVRRRQNVLNTRANIGTGLGSGPNSPEFRPGSISRPGISSAMHPGVGQKVSLGSGSSGRLGMTTLNENSNQIEEEAFQPVVRGKSNKADRSKQALADFDDLRQERISSKDDDSNLGTVSNKSATSSPDQIRRPLLSNISEKTVTNEVGVDVPEVMIKEIPEEGFYGRPPPRIQNKKESIALMTRIGEPEPEFIQPLDEIREPTIVNNPALAVPTFTRSTKSALGNYGDKEQKPKKSVWLSWKKWANRRRNSDAGKYENPGRNTSNDTNSTASNASSSISGRIRKSFRRKKSRAKSQQNLTKQNSNETGSGYTYSERSKGTDEEFRRTFSFRKMSFRKKRVVKNDS